LFVNEAVDLVTTTFDGLGLDLIQLHGDEPPEYLAQLDDRPVMKAFRMKSNGIKAIEDYVCRTGFQPVTGEGNSQPVGNLSCVLIDSYVEGVYGGSGAKADWGGCAAFARNVKNPPLVLAGGLCPENVAKAIETVRPAAVDTASGVESSPGHKDRRLMALFVENARRGFLSKDG
jgi:phosphoribosylanthranilate isomerase